MAAWISEPLQLHSSREFMCDPLNAEQCTFYMQRWHFWYATSCYRDSMRPSDIFSRYIADRVFALPTIAFFVCVTGIFIISHNISSTVLGYRRIRSPPIWPKVMAASRYLSYRGFYARSFRWNSAPIGVLLLGLLGTVFFFCEFKKRSI
jgi:hypothetical protein